ncbi:Asp-tRNA(Asn)/Glu-tRNA(Gln) amidotransferase subunit GatA [Treponema sp. OMZ 840]|uniref:Asp-tRNA(Asn)/Glu-tRNA(Gln) amidotransferase subunit GatA n=1 Tax=Treponema sp. OMZ 840 TaxID=244313 RepID=UPI003D908686
MKQYTVLSALQALENKTYTCEELVAKSIDCFEQDLKTDAPLNAFLEIYADALVQARRCDEERDRALAQGPDALKNLLAKKPLLGIPFGVKDNISVRGKSLTCASHILEGYTAPYNATVIQRLVDAGAVPLGRCNQDEFAMGSSTEYSAYGPTRNPINRTYVAGGSSGGSAAAVASGMVPFALGTETGGSVRLPASYCGVYGLKPTYGLLSRWGITAFGSSLDQAGVFGVTPDDIALPLRIMSGKDFYDDTSEDIPAGCEINSPCPPLADTEFASLKIAVPRQFAEAKGLDEEVAGIFEKVQTWFKERGSSIELVDIPVLDASIASYYVIALSEAASNLSRFDGIRYGNRKDRGEGYDDLFIQTRSEGFGAEVKRRIIIGNYVLSDQFSGTYYKRAMGVRARIQREIAALYKTYSCILCPTCPTPAFKLGQKTEDPMAMYLSDMFTVFVNLSRTASLNVPAGTTSAGLPVGVQFAGPMFSENRLLSMAKAWHTGRNGEKK